MAILVNSYTLQVSSGHAKLTLTFTRNGSLLTTHEYNGTLVKRIAVQMERKEVVALAKFLLDNLNVEPLGGKKPDV